MLAILMLEMIVFFFILLFNFFINISVYCGVFLIAILKQSEIHFTGSSLAVFIFSSYSSKTSIDLSGSFAWVTEVGCVW